jgi:6-pyruvoyltetrahydropterin/6-carboxytetrahydropterin synthase
MYRISVRSHFDAAHALRGYKGKCENLHGHRFEVVAALGVHQTDDTGLGYDFAALKESLNSVLKGLDHANLNDTPPFDKLNPSSENLAQYIYGELKAKVQSAHLVCVEVWESPDAWVAYSED